MLSHHNPEKQSDINLEALIKCWLKIFLSTHKATYQNLAYSDIINIEIARLWEDGNCCTNQGKEQKKDKKYKVNTSIQLFLTA